MWPLQGRGKESSFLTFTPRTPAVPADSSLGPHPCLDPCTCAVELQSSPVLSAQKVQMRSRTLTESAVLKGLLETVRLFFFLIVKGTKEFIHYPVAFQISPWKIIPIRLFGASVHGHFLRETKRAQPEETEQEPGSTRNITPFHLSPGPSFLFLHPFFSLWGYTNTDTTPTPYSDMHCSPPPPPPPAWLWAH